MWPSESKNLREFVQSLHPVTRLNPDKLKIFSIEEYADPQIYGMLTRCEIPIHVTVPVSETEQKDFLVLPLKLVGMCLELELSPFGMVGHVFQPHLHALRHAMYHVHKPELDSSTGRETLLHGRLGAPFFVQWKVSSSGLLHVYNLVDASTAHANALPLFMCLEMLMAFLELVHGPTAFECNYLRAHSMSGIVNFGFVIDTYALRAYTPYYTRDLHETQPGKRGEQGLLGGADFLSSKLLQEPVANISMPTRPRRIVFFEDINLTPEASQQLKALFFALSSAEQSRVLATVAEERLRPFWAGAFKTTFTPGASIPTQDGQGVISTVLCYMTHETGGATIKSVQSLFQLTYGVPMAVFTLLRAQYARRVLCFLLKHMRQVAIELFVTTQFACHHELLCTIAEFGFELRNYQPAPCGVEAPERHTLDSFPLFHTHGLPSNQLACEIQISVATGLMENLSSCCNRHSEDLEVHSTKEVFEDAENRLLVSAKSNEAAVTGGGREPGTHISKKRKIAAKLALAGTGLTVKVPKKRGHTLKALHKSMKSGAVPEAPLPLTQQEFAAATAQVKPDPHSASSTLRANKTKTKFGVNVEAQSCILTLLCWHLPKVSSAPNDPHFEQLLQNHQVFDFFPQFRTQ